MTRARVRGGLAAALALGAAAGVPTVVAASEKREPGGQALARWGTFPAAAAAAACSEADDVGAGAAAGPWSPSRVLEEALQRLHQLASSGGQPDGPGSDGGGVGAGAGGWASWPADDSEAAEEAAELEADAGARGVWWRQAGAGMQPLPST